MAPQKSPAFSFYAKDWLAATLTWALDARGAYATLLAYQWDAGSVPGDDMAGLARVLGVNSLKARAVWAVISGKFDRRDDGTWINTRLEQERTKQSNRRAALSENGSKGGRPKQTETNRLSGDKPDANLNKSLPSSFSSSSSNDSSKNDESTTTPSSHGGGLIVSPREWARLSETHAFVGSQLRVPKVLHFELMGKSGTDADRKLQAWYLQLNSELEESGKGTGDVFAWLRPRHQAYAIEQGWVDPAPKPSTPEKKPFSVADAIARKAGQR
jgi:uncharacterized protein YdaU (DUF1376 family)